jgi:tetratricopeptide (TPR) repeat protein
LPTNAHSSEQQPDTRLLTAVQHIKAGEAAAALAPLQAILAQAPGDGAARYALAAAQLKSGNAAAALLEFETLLDQAPKHDGAAYGRGLALFALGERRAALSVFRHLTRGGHFAWKAWASIADITPHEGERTHALNSAADILAALSAHNGEAAGRRAAAAALIAARRPAEAEALLAQRSMPVSGAPMPDRLLARALYHQGRFEDAFIEACRLLSHMPAPDDRKRMPPAFRPDMAGEVLSEILDLLASAGAAAFLMAGTLLGFHRQGAPLAHDRDIDIGVIRDPAGGPDIAAILRAHDRILLPRIARPGDRYFGVTHKGVAVDIFLHDESGKHLTCGFSELDGDIQWRFSKFAITSATYSGRQWPIPDRPGCYLAETYGPGWQIQDTGFASAISSPALYRTHAHARAYYAASRARAALIAGDAAKAVALIGQSPVAILPPPGLQSGAPFVPPE